VRKNFEDKFYIELIKIWNTAKECFDFYGMSRGNLSSATKYNSDKDEKSPIKQFMYIFKFN
jgi:hypothetical protein